MTNMKISKVGRAIFLLFAILGLIVLGLILLLYSGNLLQFIGHMKGYSHIDKNNFTYLAMSGLLQIIGGFILVGAIVVICGILSIELHQ